MQAGSRRGQKISSQKVSSLGTGIETRLALVAHPAEVVLSSTLPDGLHLAPEEMNLPRRPKRPRYLV